MIKKVSLLILVGLMTFEINAENIILAPIVCYDEKNQTISIEEKPNVTIFNELKTYWFNGLLSFVCAKDEEYGFVYNIIDAEKLCSTLNSKYVIYGYFQKNENSWYGNLKLYDSNRKKVVKEFFASDEAVAYDRFIKSLEANILSGLESFVGVTSNDKIIEKKRPFELRIPASGFYWNPIDSKWSSAILGVAGGNLGLEIYPSLQNNIFNFIMIDYSGTLQFSYLYGMGAEDNYPFDYHTIAVGFPIKVHFHFSDRHSAYIGGGLYYEFEIMQIQQKYEDVETLYQNMFGTEAVAGYEFSVNNFLKIFTEVEIDFHTFCDSFISIKPTLGVEFSVFRSEQ